MTIKLSMSTVRLLSEKIRQLEMYVESKMKLRDDYQELLKVPGIGKILGLTIMLEVGDMKRFKDVGNFTSYCRCASTRCTAESRKGWRA